MILKDDRDGREKFTHNQIVFALDTFLTGWGKCENGKSYAGWACRVEDLETVKKWVKGRSDTKGVRVVGNDYRPTGAGHYHIYVVDEHHPALRGGN